MAGTSLIYINLARLTQEVIHLARQMLLAIMLTALKSRYLSTIA
jgi:hypothetical protein